MRFTTHNLCWLTITVAIAAALVRYLGFHAVGGVVIFGGFLFAPLLLALVSSLFQTVSIRTRKRTAYVTLALLGGTPMLIATLVFPCFGMVVAFLIIAFWGAQVEIFNDLHRIPGAGARTAESGACSPTSQVR